MIFFLVSPRICIAKFLSCIICNPLNRKKSGPKTIVQNLDLDFTDEVKLFAFILLQLLEHHQQFSDHNVKLIIFEREQLLRDES